MLGKMFFQIILGVILLAPVSHAQDSGAEQMLIKAGYLLSVESVRLNLLREEIVEIRRKRLVSSQGDDPEICQISTLITNLFWVETVCSYESLLLSSLQNMAEEKKAEYFKLQYSRLKNVILKKMYLNFKSTQSNLANITDPEIRELSGAVKKELLKVLKLIEEEINMLENQINSAN